MYNFHWDGKGDKIKRSVILNEYKDGGLKILDIQSFNSALKTKWVQKDLDDSNHAKWKLFFDYFIKKHEGKLLLTVNLNQADVAGLSIQDNFTKEVTDFSLTLPTCLGLVGKTKDTLLHHALLIGRYHIYSSKVKKTLPNLQVFSQTFIKCQEIEKYFAFNTKSVNKYNSK